jgi:hypothetical protein
VGRGGGWPGGDSAPPRPRRKRTTQNPQPPSSLESDDDGLDENDRALAAALGALASDGGRGFEDGVCHDSVWGQGSGDEEDSEHEDWVVDPDLAGDPDLPDEGSVFHVAFAAPWQCAPCASRAPPLCSPRPLRQDMPPGCRGQTPRFCLQKSWVSSHQVLPPPPPPLFPHFVHRTPPPPPPPLTWLRFAYRCPSW